MNQKIKTDDHHCNVIERNRMEIELAECDVHSYAETDRNECYARVKEISKKREYACKYS